MQMACMDDIYSSHARSMKFMNRGRMTVDIKFLLLPSLFI